MDMVYQVYPHHVRTTYTVETDGIAQIDGRRILEISAG